MTMRRTLSFMFVYLCDPLTKSTHTLEHADHHHVGSGPTFGYASNVVPARVARVSTKFTF